MVSPEWAKGCLAASKEVGSIRAMGKHSLEEAGAEEGASFSEAKARGLRLGPALRVMLVSALLWVGGMFLTRLPHGPVGVRPGESFMEPTGTGMRLLAFLFGSAVTITLGSFAVGLLSGLSLVPERRSLVCVIPAGFLVGLMAMAQAPLGRDRYDPVTHNGDTYSWEFHSPTSASRLDRLHLVLVVLERDWKILQRWRLLARAFPGDPVLPVPDQPIKWSSSGADALAQLGGRYLVLQAGGEVRIIYDQKLRENLIQSTGIEECRSLVGYPDGWAQASEVDASHLGVDGSSSVPRASSGEGP